MALSFVGSAENSAVNGADVTLTLPGPPIEGDLVLVAYAIGDNDGLDFNMAMVTAGYTELADRFVLNTQDTNLGVFYKVMGATPDTSAVVDGQGGADAAVAAVCMVFRGINTTTPIDVTTTAQEDVGSMHPILPAIDWVTAGVWTVIVGASGHTLGGAGTYTFPTGYTTNAIDRGQDDTSDVTVGMGYRTNPIDPEDPGVMTHSGTNSANFSWCAATIALRPSSVSPTRGRVSWADAEAPLVATRGRLSWTEAETPLAPTRGRVSWSETETPIAPTRGQLSWSEAEAPNPPADPTRGRVSFGEFEAPLVGTRGRVSFAEAEAPLVATRGRIAWAEGEAPIVATRGRVSWGEAETPLASTRGRIAWAECAVPDEGTKDPYLFALSGITGCLLPMHGSRQ